MRFWSREIAGWLLVLVGLVMFAVCYLMIVGGAPIQAGPLAFLSFVIFRGGIHLLKVAVAAAVCTEALKVGDRAGR